MAFMTSLCSICLLVPLYSFLFLVKAIRICFNFSAFQLMSINKYVSYLKYKVIDKYFTQVGKQLLMSTDVCTSGGFSSYYVYNKLPCKQLCKSVKANFPLLFCGLFFWRQDLAMAQAGLKLMAILLPQPLERQGYRCMPPCPAHSVCSDCYLW